MPDTIPPRPTFTNGQYIGADDLNAAVGYARDETERLALSGKTWGIATGLALVEIPDATGAIQMWIEPGIAWDGYGRPIVLLSPAPVTTDLFAGLDPGNQTVWLRYRSTATQMVAPGFQTCGAGDPATRITDNYVIEAGSPSVTQRTDGITLNGNLVADPRDMLIAMDQAAPVVLDGSAAHQSFPGDNASWLIPVGIANYVAGPPASFAARSPAQLVQNRLVRRMTGTVAESVLAADGVLRLRDRFTDQQAGVTDDQLETQSAIQTTDVAADPNNPGRILANELVWVEGNMRVTGNARMFGTRLELRDKTGAEAGGAPEFLRRGISASNSMGGQDLQVCIGATTGTAGMDRLAIGIVKPADATHPDGELQECMVVRTDAKAAIGTNAIDSYNAAANTLVLATTADNGITIASGTSNTGNVYFADGTSAAQQKEGFVSYDHKLQKLTLGAGSNPVLSATQSGQVVIGPADPSLFPSDASQLVVSDPGGGPAGITIDGGTGTAARLNFGNGTTTPMAGSIRYNLALDRMEMFTNAKAQVFINSLGWVGIGTDVPIAPLQVASSSDPRSLTLDLTSVQARWSGAASNLALQPAGGNLGVGFAAPVAKLHVRADTATQGLMVDELVGPFTVTALVAGQGRTGVGVADPPRTMFDVRGFVAGDNVNFGPDKHVAVIENLANGVNNILLLKADSAGALPPSNMITFMDAANNQIGAVEASSSFGFNFVTYNSYSAADYAEAVPRAKDTPKIAPGSIVGVHAGEVSLATDGADAVFVTTAHPAVLGNAQPREQRDAFEMLAFLGQVQVLVDGKVQPGDLIAASGKGDGVGRVVSVDALTPEDLPLIVGRAWEAQDERGPARVNALVGPAVASAAASSILLARQAAEIARLSQQLGKAAAAKKG